MSLFFMTGDSSITKSLTEKWPVNCDNEIITNDYDYYALFLILCLKSSKENFQFFFELLLQSFDI